jgi:hypothetical protein
MPLSHSSANRILCEKQAWRRAWTNLNATRSTWTVADFEPAAPLSHFTDRLLRARHKLLAHMTSVAEAKFENFQARVA